MIWISSATDWQIVSDSDLSGNRWSDSVGDVYPTWNGQQSLLEDAYMNSKCRLGIASAVVNSYYSVQFPLQCLPIPVD